MAGGAGTSPRVYQLDALRGLLALGVVAYHVLDAPEAFGTWGVYAFFVLSGFAMEHVYGRRLDVRTFAAARIARLAPLWIPVVLVTALLDGVLDPIRLGLNLTGAFGFVAPGATSIPTGGWSIGIEVVCYAAFVALAWRRLPTPALAAIAAAALALRFALVGGLMPADLDASWVAYTIAPNFVGFFLVGMVMARAVTFRQWSGWPARISTWLGDASYGTYLLHPLIALVLGPATIIVAPIVALALHPGEVVVGRWIRRRLRGHVPAQVQVGVAPRGLQRVHDSDVVR